MSPPSKASPDDLPVPVGTIVGGKYRVERFLGRGGFGIVAVGRHVRLQQKVAIKMLRPSGLRDPATRARFAREAMAASRMKTEHVARVIDVGETDDGLPFIIMEYLEGSDLAAMTKARSGLPVAEAVDYVLQACEALAEAHSMGIVHRDLKPANLFVTHGADGGPLVKVLDFGVSKLMPGGLSTEALTESEVIIGSPQYMSPEQLRSSRDVDHRTDIWALGIVLYKLITNEYPFQASSAAEHCAAVLTQVPRPIEEVLPDLAAMGLVIARCLQRDPNQRFGSVVELSEALAPFASDDGRSHASRIVRVARVTRNHSPSLPPPLDAAKADAPTMSPGELGAGTEETKSASIEVTFGTASARTADEVSRLRPRRRWPTVLVVAIAIAGGGGALYVYRSQTSPVAATVTAPTPADSSATSALPPVVPAPSSEPAPSSSPASPQASSPASSSSASPAHALTTRGSRPNAPAGAAKPVRAAATAPAKSAPAAQPSPPPADTGTSFTEYGARK